ncbi:MAG: hypothetical protein A2X32_05005 [Elusimicrobia bacterium GWC2_64_44]|nr:MAG: hypothetical protein A2X32_05005 [Elusimicrobia bacterium GWC2_64_44]
MTTKASQNAPFPGSGESSDAEFSGLKYSGAASGLRFDGCLFRNCDLTGAEFRDCRFTDCAFESCNLSLVRLPRTALSGLRFKSSKLTGVNWAEAAWPRIKLPGALKFEDCVLSDACFLGLHLREAVFAGCLAKGADFREADLEDADLTRTDFSGALFVGTNLSGADLSGARNYAIRAAENKLKGAKFSLPEAMALLYCMDIKLV